jgi:hypothetical protein
MTLASFVQLLEANLDELYRRYRRRPVDLDGSIHELDRLLEEAGAMMHAGRDADREIVSALVVRFVQITYIEPWQSLVGDPMAWVARASNPSQFQPLDEFVEKVNWVKQHWIVLDRERRDAAGAGASGGMADPRAGDGDPSKRRDS